MTRLILTAAAFAFAASGALAAQTTVRETQKLDAAPAEVWAKIGHFSDLNWLPPVKSTEASNGDKTGSQRRLDLGGPILWESLVASSPTSRSYTYRILDNGSNQKILPVANYLSKIEVKPAGKGSEVVWTSHFVPVEGTTAEAAQKAIAGVYRAGLDALAKGEAAH
jgi:mxaD protein